MAVDLFDSEEQIVQEGLRNLAELDWGSPEAQAVFATLLDAYRRSYREKRRLVRLSDKLQEQLSGLNEELRASKNAAEEALDRLRETQESLVQAEKLASLGLLVSGVAHEINTPVGTALASASFLAQRTEALAARFRGAALRRSDLAEFVAAAEEATGLILSNCRRAAELIRGFKQVAVDQTSAGHRRFAVKAYLQELLMSLGPRLKQAAHEVVVDCPEDLELEGFPGALSQVLTNLIVNSLVHAFAPGQRGRLTIAVTPQADGTVRLRYADDGMGIPAEDLPRIFDPFFTTRRGSGGSGLGLHVVYNTVVGTLRGQIAVESTPGRGTVFVIQFPTRLPRGTEEGNASP